MGKNKVPTYGVRFTQEQYDWLKDHASESGKAVNAIIKEALELYRQEQPYFIGKKS